jgi:hypothetical protein
MRVAQYTQVVLQHTFTVDEVATDASAGVTVSVKRLDGTVVTSGAATHPGGAGKYEYTLPGGLTGPASATWQLDTLTVDWEGNVGGSVMRARDVVEVCGGFYFSTTELRARHSQLANTTLYTAADLTALSIQAEQECESISGQAWVPRFARFLLNGTGTDELVLPDTFIRAIRAVSVAYRAGATFTALTGDTLAAVALDPSGVIARDDGAVWTAGRANVLIEYEHGHDYPRPDIKDKAMTRVRSLAGSPKSSIPDRAVQFTTAEGAVYRLTGAGPRSTGIADVDAAYLRGAVERVWIS